MKTEYISENIKSEYILGPRDEINITFKGLNDFSVSTLLIEMVIFLPELGLVEVEVKQLAN